MVNFHDRPEELCTGRKYAIRPGPVKLRPSQLRCKCIKIPGPVNEKPSMVRLARQCCRFFMFLPISRKHFHTFSWVVVNSTHSQLDTCVKLIDSFTKTIILAVSQYTAKFARGRSAKYRFIAYLLRRLNLKLLRILH